MLARFAAAMSILFAAAAPASALEGQPAPWQLGFQPAATAVMAQTSEFYDLLLIVITAITLFVLALLVWVGVRYNAKANPTPSKVTHHTLLEVAWTVVPVLILILIAVPSFRLLYAQYEYPKADVTIKAIGNQWYWSYEYPDAGNFTFDALMVEDADLKPGQPRLLATDNDVVVPVNKNVHVLLTSNDVIHDWAMPAFGNKMDAVPGRTSRTWFRAEKTGMFYGQCSELCGARHAYMPIAVRVVTQEEYDAWLVQAKEQFAKVDDGTVKAAQAPQPGADGPAAGARVADNRN